MFLRGQQNLYWRVYYYRTRARQHGRVDESACALLKNVVLAFVVGSGTLVPSQQTRVRRYLATLSGYYRGTTSLPFLRHWEIAEDVCIL